MRITSTLAVVPYFSSKFWLMLLICSVFSPAVILQAADVPVYAPVKAEYLKSRDGLGNVLQKLNSGKEVTIAYLGGSITAANGWRVQSREWFNKEFPKANIKEVHAAIGGTGSDLGVFRVGHDALASNPDLLFVEFSVNDGGASPDRIWKGMEGIVRQTWAKNPETDICFVYTFAVGQEKDLRAGNCPRAASSMEMLADFYGIPSVNFAKKVVEMEADKKLIFKAEPPAPAEMTLFSTDGVHPLDAGHQIYTDLLADAIKEMEKTSKPLNHESQLSKTFVEDNWQAAKMIPLESKYLPTGNWVELPANNNLSKSFANRLGQIWEADAPGSTLTFKFKGSIAKVYDLLAPDGGQVTITVDGKKIDKLVPRFDSYCTYPRISTLTLAENLDPNAVHTVSLEIHPDQPDRQPVAFRLKDPEKELKAAKYQGTKVRVGQIMILGELVD